MEVENEDEILQRLFFKKFGYALPDEKSVDVDLDMTLIDQTDEHEEIDATPNLAPVVIVKTESIKVDDTVKTTVNQAKAVDKIACFSLKQAPSGEKSDFNRMSSKQTSLSRIDIKSPSDDVSQIETSVQRSWRLNSEKYIDSTPLIAAAKRNSMLKEQLSLEQRRTVIFDRIKRRKDAADHEAKQYKLTSAGASSMPVGLTPRPDPNRTQQGPYNQAGPQFIGQHFGQPPPMFPNPPPMPPNLSHLQQHQAAAGLSKRLPLPINFNGIPKLKVPIYDGELSEYQKFKLTFNMAYDNGRNLPKQHLVSLLEMSLQGKPLKFVSDLRK